MSISMEERLDHARAVLNAYFAAKGEQIVDTVEELEMRLDTDASDLIADLLHLQKHLGHDVEITLMRAEMHYEAEQEEYAADGGDI